MAAPPSKTLRDLSGKWVMNKTLSDSSEPALALQGVGWFVRKGIAVASVTLNIKEYTAPPKPPVTPAGGEQAVHIDIVQTATGGIKGTTELWCVDRVKREHSDWLFGNVTGSSRWVTRAEITDEYLKRGWIEADQPGGDDELIETTAENFENGWLALQIWGFQLVGGERRYARNIVVTKGSEKVEMRLVYDWAGEKLDVEI